MIPFDVLLVFASASVALAIAPGPDNIFVLTQSAIHGRRAGLLVTLGLCTGLLAHIAAVALGVAAILKTSAVAFTVLKLAGAAYLLYLAWQAFRAGSSSLTASKGPPLAPWALYRRGIIMNVTNPKVAIFFLAFLPQFISASAGPVVPQVAVLGAVFIACALFAFSLISVLAGAISARLMSSEKAQIMLNRVAALVFVGLAAKLATAHN